MSDVVIAAATLEGFRAPAGVTQLNLRVYCNVPFTPSGEESVIQPGVLGSALWFRSYTCTITGSDLEIPEITDLPATIDGIPGNARLSAGFFHPDTGALVASFAGLENFVLPASPSSTSWGAVFNSNVLGITLVPADGSIAPPAASGTNIAGANLDIHGGQATGDAAPGILAVRYPLIGASGSSVQALSDAFPVVSSMYTNITPGDPVADGTNETSIFTGATASPGSTRTIQGGSCRVGTKFHIRVYGTVGTVSNPTLRIKVKLNSVAVADTGACAIGNLSGLFFIDCILHVNAIGASGLVRAVYEQRVTNAVSNTITPAHIVGAAAEPTVDFTADQLLDITAQWNTAGGSITIQMLSCSIERVR